MKKVAYILLSCLIGVNAVSPEVLAAAPVRPAASSVKPAGAKSIPIVRTGAKSFSSIGDKWAVVIGVSQFEDERIPQLRFSAKDATDFAEYLTDPNGGKFRKDHVKVLLNEDATKINIMDMLGDSFLPHAAGPNDLVVIFLSTHGSPAGADIRGVNYVIANDTRVDKLFATGLEMRQLLRMVKDRVHTNNVLLVMDTCYSGAGAEGSHKGLNRSNINPKALIEGNSSVVISSSSPDQRSWESETLKNGYFTKFLIDSLKKTSAVDQAFDTMKDKVQSAVLKDRGEMQTPIMVGTGSKLLIDVIPSVVREAPETIPLSTSSETVASASTDDTRKPVKDFATYGQHVRTAVKLADDNKMWEAAHEIEEAIKLNPSSVQVYLMASDVYDEQGRYREALESAKHAVLNGDQSAPSHTKLSRAYFRMNAKEEATRQAQQAVTLDPLDSMAHHMLGLVNEKSLNRIDVAEQSYRKALELNPANVRAMVSLAQLLSMQNRNEQVPDLLSKAIAADADDWEARLELGRMLCRQKQDYKAAEAEIRKAAALNPNNPIVRAELGAVISQNGADRYEDAELEFKKAAKLGEQAAIPHALLANFLLDKRNRTDEAEKEYRAAIALDDTLDDASVRLGDLLITQHGAYSDADTLFKRALQLNPRNANALIGLSRISDELMKDYAGADQYLRKAIILLDKQSSHAHDLLGVLLKQKLHRIAEAQKEFETALELDPKNAAANFHYGMLLLETAKPKVAPDKALAHLKAACTYDPSNSIYWTKLGYVSLSSYKDHKTAMENFRKAIDLNLGDSEAHYRLGMLLIEKYGERKSGEKELKTAREQNPKDKEIETAFTRYVR